MGILVKSLEPGPNAGEEEVKMDKINFVYSPNKYT